MAYSYNRVILVGNLTRDPELRYTPTQTAVSEVGLAVNDRRKNAQGEWIDEVTFVDVTLWGRTAEVACEYLKKGASVMFEGRLKLDSWEGNDGQKRSKLRVVAERMLMLGGKQGGGGGGGGGGGNRSASNSGSSGPSYDESEYSQPSHDHYDAPPPAARATASPAPQDDIPF